jgi:hypothetical protein
VQSLLHQARKLELPPRVEAKNGRVLPKESYTVNRDQPARTTSKVAHVNKDRFKAAYESGVPICLLVERFSISEETIRDLVKQIGIKPRVTIKRGPNQVRG